MADNRIKILIVTGVYPPDIGGPATYAFFIRAELLKLGCQIKVIAFGEKDRIDAGENIYYVSRAGNILTRYLKFFRQVYRQAGWMDIVYTLDLMSVGLPATLAAKLKGKKVVFRTGGDFLWEKACQSGWTSLPLSQYYESEMSWREKALIWFCRQLLKRADAILFSTDWQKNIYKKYYGVSSLKAKILANALPFIKIEKNPRFKDSVIFAGRLIKVKNLERLIRVFSGIEQVQISLLIFGEGPEKGELKKLIAELGVQEKIKLIDAVDHRTLMSAIAGCRFFILPSLAEISPNLALECSVLAKPIILTRETGLDEVVTQSLILVNPLSEEDIAAKIKYLLDDNNLAAYEANLRQINFSRREWNQVAKEHHEVFKEIMRTA